MKLIVNGHATHGKDYLADAVARKLKLKKLNASMFFAETVMVPAFPNKWSCVEDCYLDRVNHRDLWYQMMRIGDWQDKFMEVSDVFCGHRNIKEHMNMVSKGGYLTVWVEWEGKETEPSSSTQWQDNNVILANHDITLIHKGEGTDWMVAEIERFLNEQSEIERFLNEHYTTI